MCIYIWWGVKTFQLYRFHLWIKFPNMSYLPFAFLLKNKPKSKCVYMIPQSEFRVFSKQPLRQTTLSKKQKQSWQTIIFIAALTIM